MERAADTYMSHLAVQRTRVTSRPLLHQLLEPGDEAVDPKLAHAFVLQWTALSMHCQEHGERYAIEASHRCREVGERALSQTMLDLAGEAIDRYRRIADDSRISTQRWNERHEPHVDHTMLLMRRPPDSVLRLFSHLERLLAGPRPWTYLAALVEIEACAAALTRIAPELQDELRSTERGRPGQAMADMTALLDHKPERLAPLLEAANATLERIGDILDDCVIAAANLASRRDRGAQDQRREL